MDNYRTTIIQCVEARWPRAWLVRSPPDRVVRVRVLVGGVIVLCFWARHFTLTVPLSTQVYKWVRANLMLEVTLLVHRRVTPGIKFADTHLYTWVERGTVRVVSCPGTQCNVPGQGLNPDHSIQR